MAEAADEGWPVGRAWLDRAHACLRALKQAELLARRLLRREGGEQVDERVVVDLDVAHRHRRVVLRVHVHVREDVADRARDDAAVLEV
eukprot:5435199-Prymnesium_polylepis.1